MTNAVKRIGVLTSGGDAPGMNAAIRAVVRSSTASASGADSMDSSTAILSGSMKTASTIL